MGIILFSGNDDILVSHRSTERKFFDIRTIFNGTYFFIQWLSKIQHLAEYKDSLSSPVRHGTTMTEISPELFTKSVVGHTRSSKMRDISYRLRNLPQYVLIYSFPKLLSHTLSTPFFSFRHSLSSETSSYRIPQ